MGKWVENQRARPLCVLDADEVARLEVMGAILRKLRADAGMSRPALARASGISASHIACLEHAVRRPRATTLHALALALSGGNEAVADAITAELVDAAGASVAPSNRFSDRRERNRPRRQAKAERLAALVLPVAEAVAEELVREMLVGHRLVPLPERDRRRQGEPIVREPRWKGRR